MNIVQVVEASQDALVAGDMQRYLGLLAEDVVLLDPSAPPIHGREAARKFAQGLLSLFTEVAFVDRKVFPFGRSAAMRFSLRLRTAAGAEGTMEGVDVFELNEQGLIQKMTSYVDASVLAGLLKP